MNNNKQLEEEQQLQFSVFLFYQLFPVLAVFLIPALLVYLLFKVIEDVMKLISLILCSWSALSILGILCIAQGVLLYFNHSLLLFYP